MSEISPVLSELSKSSIPIPGQENTDYSEVITIDRVLKNVLVLPTKTKPKKIAFIGSEGKEHMFLFKVRRTFTWTRGSCSCSTFAT